VQQRDYTLPGLAGGLGLVRTWNSLLQVPGPPTLAGMFGRGWRSTYEEMLTGPDSNNNLKYWRGDGSAWAFTYNSTLGTYSLTSPPNERAQLVQNPATGGFTLTLADGTQKIFNSEDLLAAIIDRNNNQTTLAYDASNRLSSVTAPGGGTLTFAYNDPNNTAQATSVADGVGTVATYTYDSNADLTQVLYPDGSALNFTYDPSSFMLLSVTDAQAKLIESHTYDSLNRALTSARAYAADEVSISYPASGQTQLSDSMGNITTYSSQTISGRNFVSGVSGTGCASCGGRGNQSLTFDALGNELSFTDALNNTTSYTYDSMGNVLTKSQRLNANTNLTWTYTYNSFQEVLTATDPAGNTTTNVYDANGNLLSTTTPPPGSSGAGLTTTFQYDSEGELTQVTDPKGNPTTMTYTPAGLVASITDAQGNTTSFTYDGRGNRLTSTDALNETTTYAYDAMNRLTKITAPDGSTTQFAYDYRGRRISATDANGKTTAYQYDNADRLVAATDPAQNLTVYGYDTENNLVGITDAASRQTSFTYDAMRRVTQVTFPSSLSEGYTYDAMNNLLSKTDRNGNTINYAYDALYRLTSKAYPNSTAVNYAYDLLSRLTQVTDPTGTYSFTYDNLGRLVGTSTQYAFLTSTLTNGYTYDADSNRLTLTNPQGGVTTYSYDSLNRMTGITDFAGRNFTFSYDALGRRTGLTRPNGVNTTYSYDALSRLLSVLHQAGSTVLDGAAYTYDAAGNRISKTTLPANTAYDYSYDPIYELTQATLASTGKATEKYTYDAVGNRLYQPGVPYTYNSSNEMLTREGAPYTYNNNGNRLSKTDGSGTTSYTWDYENRLTSLTVPGTGTISHQYDPFGRRIEKVSPSGTTIYVYDGDNIIEDLNANGSLGERYTYGPGVDEPLVGQRQPKIFYYEADGLGSITSLTDPTGAIAATYTYDSFGFMTASTGSATNWFRYTGRQFDSTGGLYYYRARYYDPMSGRFLSEDPLQFDVSTNFYPYAGSNPVLFGDPLGWAKCKERPCDEWVKDILNLAAEVSRRFNEYNNPTWLLPLLGRNSRAGHLQQLAEKQDKLADEIDEYNKSGCPTPIPVPVEDLATRPLPPLTPSPIHLPPPPNISPSTVLATGAGLTAILLILGAVVLSPVGL
jgi:RHS repeat-associated protein